MMSRELREYFQRIGRKGGKSTSPSKRRAARRNGERGGRPRTKGGAR